MLNTLKIKNKFLELDTSFIDLKKSIITFNVKRKFHEKININFICSFNNI